MRGLIRNFFRRFGYDIIKTGIPYIPKTNKPVVNTIGKFKIEMPGNNIQHINYKIYPDLNAELGRLAFSIYNKYTNVTVIDVGANVGDTVAVLKSFANVSIIGIEGDDISFKFLEKNIKQFSDVTILKSFLGEKSENIKADFGSLGWNTTITPTPEGNDHITLKTLDDLIKENNLEGRNIKLIKVDVEGFDTLVLRGASTIIHKNKPVLFFEYNRNIMKKIGEDGLSTVLSFNNFGYNKIVFFDHKGTLVLASTLKDTEIIQYLHDYASSSKNLVGYYDIAIFHKEDDDIADQYLKEERKYL